jgi:DNA-binding SARP family transcriptional activator
MSLLRTTKQPASPVEPSSLASLLERGLECMREGRYAEGAVYVALVREQLAADQIQLAALLDDFMQGHISYGQAQQTLQDASRRFVEEDAAQKTRVATLENLLPTLLTEATTIQYSLHLLLPPHKNVSLQQPSAMLKESQMHQSAALPAENGNALPALYFTCFGHFEVRRLGLPVELCTNRNGQAILRYLLAQVGHRATMDTLMSVLWSADDTDVAHHKLQVAVSALRRALNAGYMSDIGGGYILCKNHVYQLNSSVSLHSDVDDFLTFYSVGQQCSGNLAVAQYEKACQLYTGPFLAEDIYADWSFIRREQLSQAYLAMCNTLAEHYLEAGVYEMAVQWATAILKENPCDEVAHQQLMRAYVALGRRNEALRQYQRCQQVLDEELSVQPLPETTKLFHELVTGSST